ncbi:MAG: hypothetical protein ACI8V5_002971 [Limisphaerales bacterium]|jgi:hypothetical protein
MRAPLDNRVIDGASIRQPKLPIAPQSQSPAVVSMLREKRCDSFLSVVSDDVDRAVRSFRRKSVRPIPSAGKLPTFPEQRQGSRIRLGVEVAGADGRAIRWRPPSAPKVDARCMICALFGRGSLFLCSSQ